MIVSTFVIISEHHNNYKHFVFLYDLIYCYVNLYNVNMYDLITMQFDGKLSQLIFLNKK